MTSPESNSRGAIVFIDDEADLCTAAEAWLGVSGFSVRSFTSARRAIAETDPDTVDCLVTDLRMPDIDGMGVLTHFRRIAPDLPVVLLTGHGDVSLAVAAMREGAHDFIEKPYDADLLVAVLDRAAERRNVGRELFRLRQRAGDDALESRLVGLSPAMTALRRAVLQLANIDVDVLVTGETGTGKEVLARALHDFSRRAARPFVAINCAAIPEAIFESEMFGHVKGAFTGAAGERIGKFEYASGGTVFLDEIESMPLALQAKVLRILQERVVEPLGSNAARPIDVRVIAASKVDLKAESEAGRFRPDLYFRLATVDLAIPPLRDRREDIPLLFSLFAAAAARRFGLGDGAPLVPPADLHAQSWPGNVRELKALAERTILGFGRPGDKAGKALPPLADRVARFEAAAIEAALREAKGSTAEAAERLGLPRRTLNEKIARYGLRVPG
ncbi:two-component system, NtrC family, C4-dicarboxylate transport response regulator DctD [Devosia enhydra]|uniref:Two-component system, NtrC family, C4-dicarboxylate transport response regulator DctD n=1 Tax=Devosia enhydra TaxID=665118 RepID=A0A1K2HZS1_9HYPH|nr:sigma-54 dependent transcriptional regulator [Devosia enhydra]SFZ85519.1 two-component system, NtrC family, C4-dicarboxylate transport response regulator DctD [Devosia enhydra]